MHPITTAFVAHCLVILAAATTIPATNLNARDSGLVAQKRQFVDTCAGTDLCCNSVTDSGNPATAQLLALLGIPLSPGYTVGISCTPINPFNYNDCTAQPVCCTWGAQYQYLVAIDCYPITEHS